MAERGEPTSYAWILNTIDTKLIERGYNLISDPQEIKATLDKHLGKEFITVDVQEGLNISKKWWFKDPTTIPHLEAIPLSERVEKAIVSVLRRNTIASFDDILKEIFLTFPNSLTPETQSIKAMLSEYAIKLPDGRWKAKLELVNNNHHQDKINELVKLGRQFGFDIWTPDAVDIITKEVLPTLKLPISDDQLKKIREIDVLWLKNNQIKYAFEVENTTQITEAISRGSNIPYNVERIILIPDEKEKLLQSKFQNVMLKERIDKDHWRVILYSKFDDFINSKNRTLEKLDKLAIKPRKEAGQQTKLNNY